MNGTRPCSLARATVSSPVHETARAVAFLITARGTTRLDFFCFFATEPATRGAVALQPATRRNRGPNERNVVGPTKYSPCTLLSNRRLRIGEPASVLISARSEGWIISRC